MGADLEDGPDGFVGGGIAPFSDLTPLKDIPQEDIFSSRYFLEDQERLEISGFPALVIYHGGGPGSLFVYIPEYKMAICGDLVFQSFPPVYEFSYGAQKLDILKWGNDVWDLKFLRPDTLIPSHDVPVVGRVEINQRLGIYADALHSIWQQTVAFLNEGLPFNDIVGSVQLPPIFANEPWLKPYYGYLPYAAKSVIARYFGWFSGEAPDLATSLTSCKRAQILVDLAGGIPGMTQRARQAELEADNLESIEKAVLLGWALHTVAQSTDSAKIYVQALRKAAYLNPSAQGRYWYLSMAKDAEALKPTPCSTSP